nr:MAG TPA: hypothetical protein [Microviridae sp.]
MRKNSYAMVKNSLANRLWRKSLSINVASL